MNIPAELTTRMADVFQTKSNSGTVALAGIRGRPCCCWARTNVIVQWSTVKSAMSDAARTRLYWTRLDVVSLLERPGKPWAHAKTGVQLPLCSTLHEISRMSHRVIAFPCSLMLVWHSGESEMEKQTVVSGAGNKLGLVWRVSLSRFLSSLHLFPPSLPFSSFPSLPTSLSIHSSLYPPSPSPSLHPSISLKSRTP